MHSHIAPIGYTEALHTQPKTEDTHAKISRKGYFPVSFMLTFGDLI